MSSSPNQSCSRRFDNNRLKALVHYIVDAVPGAVLDMIRLNRIMWFTEKEMYLRTGSTFSGESFLKSFEGPVGRHLTSVLAELEQEQKIVSRRARVIDCVRAEYLSLESPDISLFSTEALDIVGRQITRVLSGHASHDQAPGLVNVGEEIPLFSFLAVTRPPKHDDIAWAMSDDKPLFASTASEEGV